MGQYFRAVNKTKKEVVCPWCLDGSAKLWAWAASPMGALFALLLRRSSGGGGGDYYGYGPQIVEVNGEKPETVSDALAKIALIEGAPVRADPDSVVGRWAGDEVYLVGDYDSSNLYEESFGYRNISRELAETWNSFIDLHDRELEFDYCGCGEPVEQPVQP